MCRLFGLHAGRVPAAATFWLVNAPDSLAEQSRRNPEGTGIGVFGPDGMPMVDKQPIAAWEDKDFATDAHDLSGTVFVAHVRYASTGDLVSVNTHPFCQDGRIFAHNGVIGDLDLMDARIAELHTEDLVLGQTDSERVFSLVTGEIRANGGNVEDGLLTALTWVSDNVGVYAANVVLATATDLWAVRYPETHNLYLLDRRGSHAASAEMSSDRIRTRSRHLADRPSVLIASEPMDGESGWQPIAPGELVHVDADLTINRRLVLERPPTHPLTLTDLSSHAAASQHPTPTS
ncbi:MAG: class II glutamine amidotransferase [Microlunatus sp.]|nr:class II glutamine amidotransferase [Microlunatus sp.]MDN5770623.1 class II glutamine amidotransferase [Microlunatus sp.]